MLQLHLSYQQFCCLLRCDLYKRFYGSNPHASNSCIFTLLWFYDVVFITHIFPRKRTRRGEYILLLAVAFLHLYLIRQNVSMTYYFLHFTDIYSVFDKYLACHKTWLVYIIDLKQDNEVNSWIDIHVPYLYRLIAICCFIAQIISRFVTKRSA